MNVIIKRAAAEGLDFFALKGAIRALGEHIGDRAEAKDGFAWEATNDFLGLNDEAREQGLGLIRTEAGVVVWPNMRASVAREIGAEMSSTFHRAFDSAVAEMQQAFLSQEVVWP